MGSGSAIPANGAAFTLDEIVAATRGTLAQSAGGAQRVVGVFTDSRAPVPGGLFVALTGDRFDAHLFLDVAIERGAAVLLTQRGRAVPAAVPVVEVEDTLVALGDLAAFHRRRSSARVVAITGSVGKTSVKNMVAAICSSAGATLATAGNLNNLVGAPATLLLLEPTHRFLVLEIGTNRPGEIARLAEIAGPEVGLVTRVGASHLEGLGSLDGVQVEKGALFVAVAGEGIGVVNLGDPRVASAADAAGLRRRITFGAPGADVVLASRSSVAGGPPRIRVDTPAGRVEAQLALLGEHQVDNAVAAVAVAFALGIAPADIARGLESVVPAPGRMVAIPTNAGGLVLDDTYNANPESMSAALETLASIAEGRRRVAVLGDMLELGEHAHAAHEDIGRAAARAGLAVLVACGPSAQAVAEGAMAGGLDPDAIEVTPDSDAAAERVRARVQRGDIVLVKGSRGMRMETVVAALVPAVGGPAARGAAGSGAAVGGPAVGGPAVGGRST